MTDMAELTSRFDRVLRVVKDVVDSMTALDLAFEEMKKGVEGAYADAAMACTKARRAFEDETPTMDALAISLKDHQYKDPTWPKDDVSDPQMLRSAWYSFHNMIVEGKSFAPDDMIAMRNLYAALDRARKKLTKSLASKSSEAKFKWNPALLEGYVMALLKNVQDPTEREAVAWIGESEGREKPSRATLRKTYSWQRRLKKIAKPRTTNESQSGVSPVQFAATDLSHEDVTDHVLEMEDTLGRRLSYDERDVVAWTLKEVRADEEKQKQAIENLIHGFRRGDMSRNQPK